MLLIIIIVDEFNPLEFFLCGSQWDAFSVPELRNFLRILDKEEDEQREAMVRRYEAYRHRLQEALRQHRAPS